MLTSQQEEAWDDYQAVESRGLRGSKIQALGSFITLLKQSPIEEWESWARALAERVIDGNEDIPLRTPLFRAVVFPALFNGHHNQLPGCSRWLAGLSQQIYRCPDCQKQLSGDEQTELGLLWSAIRLDPSDRRSSQRIIDVIVDRLRYTLHELPTGVLYGIDGATADQCLELQAELQAFTDLLKQCDQTERFQPLIDDCQFHFREYRAYLLRVKDFDTYAEYLNQVAP